MIHENSIVAPGVGNTGGRQVCGTNAKTYRFHAVKSRANHTTDVRTERQHTSHTYTPANSVSFSDLPQYNIHTSKQLMTHVPLSTHPPMSFFLGCDLKIFEQVRFFRVVLTAETSGMDTY